MAIVLSMVVLEMGYRSDGTDDIPLLGRRMPVRERHTETLAESSASHHENLRTEAMTILENPDAAVASEWKSFVSRLSRSELRIVAETLKKLDYGPRPWLFKREEELLNKWAMLDIAAAMSFACENMSHCGDEAFAAWCDRDLEGSLAWVLQHEDALLQQTETVFRKLASTDFERARRLVLVQTNGDWPIGAVSGLMPIVVEQSGLNGLLDWISQLEDKKLRGNLVRRIYETSLVDLDPAGMLRWMDTQEPQIADPLRGRILKFLGNENPEAATSYFDSLPSSRQTPECFESTVEGLAGFNPGAADALIQRYPMLVGPRTLDILIYYSMTKFPLEALQFASRYDDAIQRKRQSVNVLRHWKGGLDDKGFTAWMNSHDIPDDWKQDL